MYKRAIDVAFLYKAKWIEHFIKAQMIISIFKIKLLFFLFKKTQRQWR